jgi:hypothetical protein
MFLLVSLRPLGGARPAPLGRSSTHAGGSIHRVNAVGALFHGAAVRVVRIP